MAVAVGDFDADDMLQQIDAYIRRRWQPGPDVPDVPCEEPEQKAERRILLRGDDPTGYYMHAFHAPAATSEDFFPLIILDAVLGGAKGMGLFGGGTNNRSNRLYRALVDTELAVGAGSSYRPTMDPSLFFFYATLAPGVSHQAIEDAAVAADPPHPGRRCARRRTGEGHQADESAVRLQQRERDASGILAGLQRDRGQSQWLDDWLPALTDVTVEDVQRVANEYFQPNRQTVGWYMPEEL